MEFLESFDQGFWNFLQAKRAPWLDPELVVVSFLALPSFLAALAVVGALVSLWRRHLAEAALVVAGYLGSFLLAILLAWMIDRPPPDVKVRPLEESLTTSSFPSRETMVATATYTSLAVAMRPALGSRLRGAAPMAALAFAILLGVCRALVGSNYPTDILAGGLGGLAWAMICYMAAERWLQPASTAVTKAPVAPA
jgi:undecaprenyl-diphosphatase